MSSPFITSQYPIGIHGYVNKFIGLRNEVEMKIEWMLTSEVISGKPRNLKHCMTQIRDVSFKIF